MELSARRAMPNSGCAGRERTPQRGRRRAADRGAGEPRAPPPGRCSSGTSRRAPRSQWSARATGTTCRCDGSVAAPGAWTSSTWTRTRCAAPAAGCGYRGARRGHHPGRHRGAAELISATASRSGPVRAAPGRGDRAAAVRRRDRRPVPQPAPVPGAVGRAAAAARAVDAALRTPGSCSPNAVVAGLAAPPRRTGDLRRGRARVVGGPRAAVQHRGGLAGPRTSRWSCRARQASARVQRAHRARDRGRGGRRPRVLALAVRAGDGLPRVRDGRPRERIRGRARAVPVRGQNLTATPA